MRHTIWYIVGGQLAAISIPAIAQDTAPDAELPAIQHADGAMMTAEQMATVESWPAEKQAAFRRWPDEVRAYFWELPAQKQDVFWRLTDGDKLAITAMDQARRDAAWEKIDAMSAGDTMVGNNGSQPSEEPDEVEEEAPEAPGPAGRN